MIETGKQVSKGGFDKFRIMVLALGHMITDCYANMIPPLLPLLKTAYDLSYAASGMMMTVFTVTSSIVQPLFGYYADMYGKRWLVAISVIWTAFFMCMIGLVQYIGLDSSGAYTVILALIGLAGFGSASYHPQASTMVPRISGDHKGFGVSLFSAGGNLGYAIMPLLVWPVTTLWGLEGVVLLFIPGLIMTLLLFKYAPEPPSLGKQVKVSHLIQDIVSVARPLSLIIGVVCMRAWLFFGLITFLPLYFAYLQEPQLLANAHLFILLFFGAMGSLIGGHVSDLYGRKFVIVASLLLTGPLLFLALTTHGILSWILTAITGMVLLASFSPAVLMAQGLIPRNQGMASGIILGFAIGIGGFGVAVNGFVSDQFGIVTGIYSLVLIPIIGLGLALLLPGSMRPKRVEAHQ